ncbi:hypothetical protein GCM10007111_23990 [Virgibacillus kapii]|uniref:WYL domain-containing protein n=2 Tax=Virgibacillus TaxID=84406 RepID=A0A024Q9C3_9BACI|nr:hypothetical protein M948_02450 [Virgibacillus sp. CM-4]GGJ61017.1 hypothetical protein GCM10007111_23990 [Virgibacillus kapii]CDQ39079.1 hypothetical protein BN990_01361 [Virgibacillus massiliensis]
MIGLLQRSKEKKQKLVLVYIDHDNQITQRLIRVVEINRNSILAYCFYRQQLRRFTFKNILSCGPVKRKESA